MTSHDHSDELTILLDAIRLASGDPLQLGSGVPRHSTASGTLEPMGAGCATGMLVAPSCSRPASPLFEFTADGAMARAVAGEFVDFGGGQ